ncbi:hypothetical protein L0636_11740 [Halomonas janggokensis]|uniref:Uncharacterized protein n=1 Tax=Vreelandella janggokensis TaxID=370767 RepID=A0ABT4IQS4_9GAMM|nr:hypothetical protein [Halomonas janggokensis]MCZ0926027.1 hypothetical protein [Halomonas janggokensis]MCZ0931094.1 hypothetical protein [Halomonas janggokensis]
MAQPTFDMEAALQALREGKDGDFQPGRSGACRVGMGGEEVSRNID